jgi:hypothetical protein
VNEVKDVPCADCGVRYPPHQLEFDHVRGTKVADVSRLATRPVGVKRLLEEIAKCEVVCANCHRLRTWCRRRRGPSRR